MYRNNAASELPFNGEHIGSGRAENRAHATSPRAHLRHFYGALPVHADVLLSFSNYLPCRLVTV